MLDLGPRWSETRVHFWDSLRQSVRLWFSAQSEGQFWQGARLLVDTRPQVCTFHF